MKGKEELGGEEEKKECNKYLISITQNNISTNYLVLFISLLCFAFAQHVPKTKSGKVNASGALLCGMLLYVVRTEGLDFLF